MRSFDYFVTAGVVAVAAALGVIMTLYLGYFPLVQYNAKFTPTPCTSDFSVLRECPLKDCYCVTAHLAASTPAACDQLNTTLAVFTACYPTLSQAETFQQGLPNATFHCSVTEPGCYLTLDMSVSDIPLITLMIVLGCVAFVSAVTTLVTGIRWHRERRYRVIPEWSVPHG